MHVYGCSLDSPERPPSEISADLKDSRCSDATRGSVWSDSGSVDESSVGSWRVSEDFPPTVIIAANRCSFLKEILILGIIRESSGPNLFIYIYIYMYIVLYPEELAFGACWVPRRLPRHSQGLTVPRKVCRFQRSFSKTRRTQIPQKHFCR